jgi:hypothetical protein
MPAALPAVVLPRAGLNLRDLDRNPRMSRRDTGATFLIDIYGPPCNHSINEFARCSHFGKSVDKRSSFSERNRHLFVASWRNSAEFHFDLLWILDLESQLVCHAVKGGDLSTCAF